MRKDFKIIFTILGVAVLSGILLFGNTAKADNPDFEIIPKSEPIFEESNLLPGDEVYGSITFLNNTSSTQIVTFKMVNYQDDNDPLFGDVLFLQVKGGDAIILDKISLTEFKDSEGAFDLLPGSKILDFIVYFDKDSGNKYQEATLSFNLSFTATWDEGITTGRVAGAAIGPSKETIPQKIGRVLGAATGSPVFIIILISFLLALTFHLLNTKLKANSSKNNIRKG